MVISGTFLGYQNGVFEVFFFFLQNFTNFLNLVIYDIRPNEKKSGDTKMVLL